jgi:uncharacterized membrane protein
MTKRNSTLDLIRSLAIFLMVIFHFIYDLKYFGWVAWDIPDGDGWKHFRYIILTLFFICIGVSLVYSHAQQVHLKKFVKRLAKVAIGAGLITLMSLVMFPQNWIFFGVLHFILIASLIAILFVPFPKLSLIIGTSIIILASQGLLNKRWPFYYFDEFLPSYTVDYVSLFPWLGVILLGTSLAHSHWLNHDIFTLNKLKNDKLIRQLAWPGKHSLVIYLVHQPLLFGILAPIHWWLN